MANTELKSDFSDQQMQLEAFISKRQSLVLATHDAQGACELGVAPFVLVDGMFAVLLSGLAAHTRHLEREPRVQIMLLDDEADSRQPYARLRMSVSCDVTRLARTEPRSDAIFELLQARFGSIVPLLRDLDDFHVFIFTPKHGRFIAGFGQAYRLEELRVVEHLRS
ncbi:MAG: HugZ family protein [Halothiobacillaceae bacterium]